MQLRSTFSSFWKSLQPRLFLVSELPVSIVKPLRDRTALEKHRVILECTVSSPRCSATWCRGSQELAPSDRVEILADGCTLKLVIQQVVLEDEGTYSVTVGEHTSTARLMVEGELGMEEEEDEEEEMEELIEEEEKEEEVVMDDKEVKKVEDQDEENSGRRRRRRTVGGGGRGQ